MLVWIAQDAPARRGQRLTPWALRGTLLDLAIRGPDVLTGGAFGPEGRLATTAYALIFRYSSALKSAD